MSASSVRTASPAPSVGGSKPAPPPHDPAARKTYVAKLNEDIGKVSFINQLIASADPQHPGHAKEQATQVTDSDDALIKRRREIDYRLQDLHSRFPSLERPTSAAGAAAVGGQLYQRMRLQSLEERNEDLLQGRKRSRERHAAEIVDINRQRDASRQRRDESRTRQAEEIQSLRNRLQGTRSARAAALLLRWYNYVAHHNSPNPARGRTATR